MKYAVYEAGKPATLTIRRYECWSNNIFNTKREAEIYAYLWCVAVTKQQAELCAPEMEIGVEYDYSFGQYNEKVMMKIEEME